MTQPLIQAKPGNAPYYIVAPDFHEASGGVRAMHYLCHQLNQAGCEAYMYNQGVSQLLDTPPITPEILAHHQLAGVEPVVIYPEVVAGNPLKARHVVRYLLNHPGFLTKTPLDKLGWHTRDLVYTHGWDIVPPGWHANLLQVPLLDTSTYYNRGDEQRSGSLVWFSRFLNAGGQPLPLTADSTEISFRVPLRTPAQLAELYRGAEVLYTYEHSTACFEALLCGCPVVYLPNPLFLSAPVHSYLGDDGVAWGNDPAQLEKARATVANVGRKYQQTIDEFQGELQDFIAHTQGLVQSRMAAQYALRQLPDVTHRSRPPEFAGEGDVSGEKLKVGVIHHDYLYGASFNIRLGDPLVQLSPWLDVALYPGRKQFSHRPEETDFNTLLAWCDLLVIQRGALGEKNAEYVDKVLASGKPWIFETDDWLPALPAYHPQYEQFQPIPLLRYWQEKIPFSSAVVASTRYLGEKLQGYGVPVTVIPNSLAYARYKELLAVGEAKDKVTIGFFGTNSHGWDMKIIEPALRAINTKYGMQRVRFVFFGGNRVDFKTEADVRVIDTGVTYAAYLPAIRRFGIDIGLGPLDDSEFNRAKSDLKWLDYTAVGAASILSNVTPYGEAKEKGLALVVDNDTASWTAALERLIEDAAYRQQLALGSYEYLLQYATQESQAYQWVDVIRQVLPPTLAAKLAGYHPGLQAPIPLENDHRLVREPYNRTFQNAYVDDLARHLTLNAVQTKVLLVVWVDPRNAANLADTLDSLSRQLYRHWQLVCVATEPCHDPLFQSDEQYGWFVAPSLDEPTRVAVLQMLAAELGAEWLGAFEAGTEFDMDALARVVAAAAPGTSMIYSDSLDGRYTAPVNTHRRHALNPLYLCSYHYIGDAAWYYCPLLAQAEVASVSELALAMLAKGGEQSVRYLADVLLALPSGRGHYPYADSHAPAQYLASRGLAPQLGHGHGESLALRLPYQAPQVAVLISNVDSFEFIKPCLDSLFDKTAYADFSVWVGDCASRDTEVLDYYQQLAARWPGRFNLVHFERHVSPAEVFNCLAAAVSSPYVVLAHNDTHFVQPAWLDELLALAAWPDAVAVVPKLVFPETGLLQCAGLILGGSKADVLFQQESANEGITHAGYMNRLTAMREVAAVHSPCVLLPTAVLQAQPLRHDILRVGELAMLEWGLRLRREGGKLLFAPASIVVHHQRNGSLISHGQEEDWALLHSEQNDFLNGVDWLRQHYLPELSMDPFYNRALMLAQPLYSDDSAVMGAWPDFPTKHPRVLALTVGGASADYRVKQPVTVLVESGMVHCTTMGDGVRRILSVQEIQRLGVDILYMQNPADRNEITALEQYRKYLPALKVIISLDDLLSEIPEESSVYKHFQANIRDVRTRLKQAFKLADRIVVSTQFIKDYYQGAHPDIRVVPNRLPRATWGELSSKRGQGSKPRVGWVGAQQHKGDLRILAEVIRRTADRVEWVFMGMWPEGVDELIAEKHQPVRYSEYPAKLASLNLDLALAPLEDNAFNAGKSNLRLLEYGVLGWPVVCSDVYPYRTDNPPVTRVAWQVEAWVAAIDEHLQQPDWSAQQGSALRSWVDRHFWLEDHIAEWQQALLGR